ncbi:MAG: hypothetical protein H0V33_05300 [Acidimicrobiia bacterium]|jgi:uridine phosphorylase|nr:hypothetical protein [Acidimicrobiia bacterium]
MMTGTDWRRALRLGDEEMPELVVLEGTWWEAERTAERLAVLDDARALPFPGWHLGRWHDRPVAYCTAYGAARAVEPVHVLGTVGCPRFVQIGSCGSLSPDVRTGDVVVPAVATIGEGASQYYGGAGVAHPDPTLADALAVAWAERGATVHRGLHVTTSALLNQPPDLVARWQAGGHLAVDLETSAVLSAAAWAGARAAATMFVWDELVHDRSWLDPFPPAERAAQRRAEHALFEVALAALDA